jgi:YspA, cpYpsA-related SLOG family
MPRVIVCGSRGWHDRQKIQNTLADLILEFAPNYPLIIHGAARGADRLCEDEAGKAGLLTEAHPARWETLGKRAGVIRNEEMAAEGAELCIAFWDGRSEGTRHMMAAAKRAGIPLRVVL